ncbi:MAG: MBL fold metallo-hydrolase [Terriglobia bacterium]
MFAGTVLALLLGGLAYAYDPFAGPTYRGPRSDHFDGKRFFNPGEPEPRGLRDFIRWRISAAPGPWLRYDAVPSGPPPPKTVTGGGLRITFINHATVLIQIAGVNILTDPVWSNRVGPVSWVGPRRRRAPGLHLDALPEIHVVLLSHNHYDHLDLPTLKIIKRAHRPVFVAPLGVAALLESAGLGGAIELDWWATTELGRAIRATCVPAQHFSMRGLRDRNNTLWCGYVLEGPAGAIYFAGDTGYGAHFEQIARRFAPFRLALLPIGAYRPEWFMSPVHMSPEDAVRAARALGAQTCVAMHFGTFALADDGQFEPVDDLRRALGVSGAAAFEFWVLNGGEGRDAPPAASSSGL